MTWLYEIDTSVLVRLVTAGPKPDFKRCVKGLRVLGLRTPSRKHSLTRAFPIPILPA